MPFYVYECNHCGHRFERFQHMSDAPIQICPECGGDVRRLIQPVGVVFKGSGFYVTDNRKKSTLASTSSKDTGKDGASSNGKDGKDVKDGSTEPAKTASEGESKSKSESKSKEKSSAGTEK